MHILVTGGSGFIGSHLVNELLRVGHRVTVVDDLSTGRAEKLETVKSNPELSIVHADLGNPELVRKYIPTATLFITGRRVGVALIAKQPIQTIHRNIYPTQLFWMNFVGSWNWASESRCSLPVPVKFMARTRNGVE